MIDFLHAVFGGIHHDYPYPCVITEEATYIAIQGEQLGEARQYITENPLPLPVVPIVIGKPSHVPKYKWLLLDDSGLAAFDGNMPSSWFDGLSHYNEIVKYICQTSN